LGRSRSRLFVQNWLSSLRFWWGNQFSPSHDRFSLCTLSKSGFSPLSRCASTPCDTVTKADTCRALSALSWIIERRTREGSEISGSLGGEYEDTFLGFSAVFFRWSGLTFRTCALPPSSVHRPDDGSSRHPRSIGLLQQDYTALYPTKLSYSGDETFCKSVGLQPEDGGESLVTHLQDHVAPQTKDSPNFHRREKLKSVLIADAK
jgi:hypothetical protein